MTMMVEAPSTNGVGEQENWLPVAEFDGRYEVSDLGRVRSRQKAGEPVPMKLGKQRDIVVAWLRANGSTFCRRVDRMVLDAFVGPAPGERFGPSHRDGNMENCRLDNMHWEDGLARPYKTRKRKPGRPKGSVSQKKSTPAVKKPAAQEFSGVREQRILYCGNVEIIVNMTDRTVDLSQQPKSTPLISLDDVADMIRLLEQVKENS